MKKYKRVYEAKIKYVLYHGTYSSAVQEARRYAEDLGYEIDGDSWFNEINTGPKKPDPGVTNRASVKLIKDGKPQRKALQIQVTNLGFHSNLPYELNCYIW